MDAIIICKQKSSEASTLVYNYEGMGYFNGEDSSLVSGPISHFRR